MKRLRNLSLALIAILLVIVILAPLPGAARGIKTLHDFAHAPIFGCVALLCLFVLRTSRTGALRNSAMQFPLAFAIAVALGAATELAQIPVGRDASWLDLRSDAIGAFAFLALFAVKDGRFTASKTLRIGCVVLAAALLSFHSAPLATAAVAYMQRGAAFPVLFDSARDVNTYFMAPQWAHVDSGVLPDAWSAHAGEGAMRVVFNDGPWPGVDFSEPAPNWQGYTALALDITNPTDVPLVLGFRVNDVLHNNRYDDRFNRVFRIAPRTRTILRVPLAEIQAAPRTRLLDLRRVADFLLFRSADSSAAQMYVARIWLE